MAGHLRAGITAMLLAALALYVASPACAADPLVCVGDCHSNGRVAVDDLLVGVNIALGVLAPETCPALANPRGGVDVSQLILATRNAIDGCPGVRFVDNGDGTISDLRTKLMWEKKVALGAGRDYGNLNAADNQYLIAGECGGYSDLCQPSEAAGIACMEGATPHKLVCNAICDPLLGLPQGCYTDEFSTLWEWLAQLNASRFAGYSDWRIPTVGELLTIVDYSTRNPAVDRAFFGAECGPACTDVKRSACSCTHTCSTTGFPQYWSASNNVPISQLEPWWVDLCIGDAAYFGPGGGTRFADRFVRAVRGRTIAPEPRFTSNGDGTISDRKTGLMWQAGMVPGVPRQSPDILEPVQYSWSGECVDDPESFCQPSSAAAAMCNRNAEGATLGCDTCRPDQGVCDVDPKGRGARTTVWELLTQINEMRLAGYDDWRVPTIVELQSIMDFGRSLPAWHSAFDDPTCGRSCIEESEQSCDCAILSYWSATTLAGESEATWHVSFWEGEIYARSKYAASSARLVRSQQGATARGVLAFASISPLPLEDLSPPDLLRVVGVPHLHPG